MDHAHLRLIALGGVVGATLRWVISEAALNGSIPWETLIANVIGSFLLGMAVALPAERMSLQLALGTGFCGGLTTFSTFAVEVALLLRQDDYVIGGFYLALSVVLAAFAFLVGRRTPHPRFVR